MIKPVKMKKINAVILEDMKDAVLRELKELGAIHLLKIQGSDMAEDLKLSPGRTAGINVKASEYLSKVEGMLDVFKLAKDEGTSALKTLTTDPEPPMETTEVAPDELFKKVEEKVTSLEEKVLGISGKLEELAKETEDIQSASDVMEKLKPLGVSPADLEDFKSTFTVTGLMSTDEIGPLNEDIKKVIDNFLIQSVEHTKKESIVIIVASRDVEADVKRIMHVRRFEEFHVPEAFSNYSQEDAETKIGARLVEIEAEKADLLEDLKDIKSAEEKDLLILLESLQIEKLMDETNTYFGNTERAFVLKGWVPVDMANDVASAIETASDNHCVVEIEEPHHHEEPPTLLNNSNIAKPIEMLTSTYGTPTYDMHDPSLLMSISFPLIFGLMFGDVGQGLFLVVMGGTLGFYLKVEEGLKKLGRVITYCGIAAMCGGVLYGEFFGLHFAVVPILSSIYPEGGINVIGTNTDTISYYLQSTLVTVSLPFHPIESVMNLIVIAFFLAIAHVSLGCMIKISDEIAHGKPLHAIVSPWGVMGLWLFWGGALVIITNGVSGTIAHIMNILTLDMAAIKVLGPSVIFPCAMIAIGGKFVEGLAPAWAIYEAYEAVSRYLFNSLSYVRIAALAVVHSVFALLMNMGLNAVTGETPHTVSAHIDAIAGTGPMVVLWIMIFMVGNAIIIILETLISFIHTLRLHYYEWFSKFYQGEGSSFKPFLALRKYTFLVPSYSEDKQ